METYKIDELDTKALENVVFRYTHINLSRELIETALVPFTERLIDLGINPVWNFNDGYACKGFSFETCTPACINRDLQAFSELYKFYEDTDNVVLYVATRDVGNKPRKTFSLSLEIKEDNRTAKVSVIDPRGSSPIMNMQLAELAQHLTEGFQGYFEQLMVDVDSAIFKLRANAQSPKEIIKGVKKKFPKALYDSYGQMVESGDVKGTYTYIQLNDKAKQNAKEKYLSSWHLGNFSEYTNKKLDELSNKIKSLGFKNVKMHIENVGGYFSFSGIDQNKAKVWLNPDATTSQEIADNNCAVMVDGLNKKIDEFIKERFSIETADVEKYFMGIVGKYRFNEFGTRIN